MWVLCQTPERTNKLQAIRCSDLKAFPFNNGLWSYGKRGTRFVGIFVPRVDYGQSEVLKVVWEGIRSMQINGANLYMHQKAPCHRSKMTKEWLENPEVLELPWSGNSPDLNPIENLIGTS